MFERYTEKARRMIFFARYEASQYGSRYIETEHLLLGFMQERRGMLAKLTPGASEASIRADIEKRIARRQRVPISVEVPLSEGGKEVLNLAGETADRFGHQSIMPEHLLMAMLRVEKCIAAQVLRARGVTVEMIQAQLGKELHDRYDDNSLLRVSERLKCFLEGLRSLKAEELATFFEPNGEFIDAVGKRWTIEEIGNGYEALFGGYAKKNATFVVEGTPVQMDDVYIATVLWKNALLASEERSWLHRMAVILVREKRDWNIALVQVTPVKRESSS